MVASAATTVTAYLTSIPPDRRKSMVAVRKMLKTHMPKGYKEVMRWGMISWEIPLTTYPDTYNGRPLCYAALAAQKNHLALYLTGVYGDPAKTAALKAAFKKAGKRLDMGKSCIRFADAADLPLAALGKAVASLPPAKFIVRYEELRGK